MHRRWSATYSLPVRRWQRSVLQPRCEAVSLRERWLLGSQAAMPSSSARSNSGLPPIHDPCDLAHMHKNCCRACTAPLPSPSPSSPNLKTHSAGSVCISCVAIRHGLWPAAGTARLSRSVRRWSSVHGAVPRRPLLTGRATDAGVSARMPVCSGRRCRSACFRPYAVQCCKNGAYGLQEGQGHRVLDVGAR
jgi:hypothetical protein